MTRQGWNHILALVSDLFVQTVIGVFGGTRGARIFHVVSCINCQEIGNHSSNHDVKLFLQVTYCSFKTKYLPLADI